jgi:carbon monoxide dehydrogenase subunit G
MAAIMPGVESFDVEDDRHWRANVNIPLGLGGLRMSFNFEKTDERKPNYARLHAKGTGVGALVSMDTSFHLSDEGAETQMRWEAEVRIAGPVGSMGQRVLQPIVNQQVQNVLAALDKQVIAAAAAPGDAGDGEQAGFAAETKTGEGGVRHGRVEAAGSETPPVPSGAAGTAGGPGNDAGERRTDPELKDVGPPADVGREAEDGEGEGSSGAEEGLSPWDAEAYGPEPEGPTRPDESTPTREGP